MSNWIEIKYEDDESQTLFEVDFDEMRMMWRRSDPPYITIFKKEDGSWVRVFDDGSKIQYITSVQKLLNIAYREWITNSFEEVLNTD